MDHLAERSRLATIIKSYLISPGPHHSDVPTDLVDSAVQPPPAIAPDWVPTPTLPSPPTDSLSPPGGFVHSSQLRTGRTLERATGDWPLCRPNRDNYFYEIRLTPADTDDRPFKVEDVAPMVMAIIAIVHVNRCAKIDKTKTKMCHEVVRRCNAGEAGRPGLPGLVPAAPTQTPAPQAGATVIDATSIDILVSKDKDTAGAGGLEDEAGNIASKSFVSRVSTKDTTEAAMMGAVDETNSEISVVAGCLTGTKRKRFE